MKLFKRTIAYTPPQPGNWFPMPDGKTEELWPVPQITDVPENKAREFARMTLQDTPEAQVIFIWPVDGSGEVERISRESLGLVPNSELEVRTGAKS